MCIINANSIKNKFLKRILDHIFYLIFVLIFIPGIYYFHLGIVLPNFVGIWSLEYHFHLLLSHFFLLNVVSNMVFGMFTDTSIKGRFLGSTDKKDWTVCSVCECLRPPRAWHCNICNICILKRDHHCTFFACCIGYFNLRYFMFFTFYIFIANSYSLYYNIKFLALFLTWNHGIVILKFLFPLFSFVFDFGYESLYVTLVVVQFVIIAFSGFLFFYHLNNLLKGRVGPEIKLGKKGLLYDKGWKSNLIEVFGSRYYLTWVAAFINSPLPGNGLEWVVEDKYK
ncbi:probable palmitoyltransferase ZDHHC24 [Amyelois transitella]|uniref:probable palmitoyltransferase ZDHHC24 n=1 Tax=Amyelois transitella TaxID=680683 RepID=UPI00067E198B|nr:probable palmitoyltransferase ZDHHC24 [Amyelois transitella]